PPPGARGPSMRPGPPAVPLALTTVLAPPMSPSFSRPTAAILPFSQMIVSASRIGCRRSPESKSPMSLITSLPAGAPAACGVAMALPLFRFVPPHVNRAAPADKRGRPLTLLFMAGFLFFLILLFLQKNTKYTTLFHNSPH